MSKQQSGITEKKKKLSNLSELSVTFICCVGSDVELHFKEVQHVDGCSLIQ